MEDDNLISFMASFTGQLEVIEFPAGVSDNALYIRYDIVHGPDWERIGGLHGAISQTVSLQQSPDEAVFNMPIDVVYRSTNVSGWPQIVLTAYGITRWGVEGIRGYGRAHLPVTTGRRVTKLPLFAPRPSTMLGEWISWFTGRTAELTDPRVLAFGNTQYLMRTKSYGSAKVTWSMISKDFHKLGFDNQPANMSSHLNE